MYPSVSFSIRALYGTNEQKNAVHGSDSEVSAEREIRFFFPNCKKEYIHEEKHLVNELVF